MADGSCQSCVAQRSVVENDVGDRWYFLHASVHHGITLMCLCHTDVLVRQIKRSTLYGTCSWHRPIYLFLSHNALPFPGRMSSHSWTYSVQTLSFLKLTFPSHLILLSLNIHLHSIVSVTVYLSLHPPLCLDYCDAGQIKLTHRVHSDLDFACYCYLSVLHSIN